MRPLPTLRQLEFLATLAEEEHFGRAAERLNVTQSTLSAGIRDLEGILGVRLADRDKRSVRMTAVGRDVTAAARHLLRDARELVGLAQASQGTLGGRLRLGAIPTIGPFLLPTLMESLRREHPELTLLLREGLTDPLLGQVRSGELDAALIALPFATAGLEVMALAQDAYHLACPVGHPLAERDAVTGADLEGMPLLLLERGHCLQRHALSAFKNIDLEQDLSFEATSLATLLAMVGGGLGMTLVPDLAVGSALVATKGVVLVPLHRACPRTLSLVWRRNSAQDGQFRALGDMLKQHLSTATPTTAGAALEPAPVL